ncbi:MAG: sugar transferase [Anaerolineae bacterium]
MSGLTAIQPSSSLNPPLRYAKPRLGSLRISERRILLALGDLLMISVALLVAVWLRLPWIRSTYGDWRGLFTLELRWWLLLWAIWIPASITADCYNLPKAASASGSIVRTVGCALAVGIIYLLVPTISAPLTYSRLSWFIFVVLAAIGVTGWRATYALAISNRSFTRRALVVGAGRSGQALAQAMDATRTGAVELVGFVDDEPTLHGQQVSGHPVLSGSERLLSLALGLQVDEVVVAISDPYTISPVLLSALIDCWEKGIPIIPMSVYYEQLAGAIPVEHLGPNLLALVDRQEGVPLRAWAAVRRLVDIVVSVCCILVFAPMLPLIALAIYVDSPGPILYWQVRVGKGGRVFRIAKFRSMIPDAEPNGATWAAPRDDRVTHVGRLMRMTRIDELPQFWNVLRGDMTLIGPRPERPEFVQELGTLMPYYAVRHSLKPGITGWAQVNLHYGGSKQDAMTKLQYDLYYVKHRGPVLDALITLRTVRVILSMQGI